MSVPFVITCDSCHARLTVKKQSLLGKRVACPGCQTPLVVRDPDETVAEALPEPLVPCVPKIRPSASGIADPAVQLPSDAVASDPVASDPVASDPVASDPVASDPVASDLATPLAASTNADQPAPVASNVKVPDLTGIPVIREVTKPKRAAKPAKAGRKTDGASKGKSTKHLFWLIGLGGAGSVAGLVALLVLLVGADENENTPPSTTDTQQSTRDLARDNDAPAFDVLAPPAVPAGDADSTMTLRLTEVVESVGDAIVYITIADQAGQEVALGTGVLFDSTGLLVTNYHVIENAAQASVHFRDGRRSEIAGYRAVDANRDLAVLQLADSSAPTPFLRLNPAADVQQGEAVIALGHPSGFKFTLTDGIVSAKRLTSELPSQYQQFLQTPPDQQWIQTTASISGGNSGGPLLNARGELVGINTWVAEGENLGFAIHVRHLVDLVNDLASEVTSLPVKPQPDAYRPTHPLVIDLWRQFRADFEEFVVRLQGTDREMAGQVFAAYNPAAEYMRRFLELAEANRGEASALEALTAVCTLSRMATGGTTLTASAYERLVEDHVDDANLRAALVAAASDLDPSARTFLDRVIETSSRRELQGVAAFALASAKLSSNNLDDGTGAQATQLLNRVVAEFGDIPWNTSTLGAAAEQTLFAAKHLVIGKTAMDVTGVDQHGDELKLSDYRGKVVVLDFWADWCPHCRVMYPHERVLVEEYDGRPFALLGVNCDERNRFHDVAHSGQISWRSCWDGPHGPIAERWQVDSFPTIYVLDHQGIIRFKGLRDKDLTAVVQLLVNLAEVESLVAQDPDQQQHLVELARCHSELAGAYMSLEEWRGAIVQWQATVACFRRLATSHPGDSEYRRRFATALVSLGRTALRSRDLSQAAQAFDEARGALQTATSPTANGEDRDLLLDILSRLGSVAQSQGDYGQAVRQFQAAIELVPESAKLLNALAWILSTCPNEAFRDGEQAVRLATKACELTRWESYAYVDTLAAALAEQGDFEQAVQQQQKAVRLAPQAIQASMNSRVKLYQGKTPYRLDRRAGVARSEETPSRAQTPEVASRAADPVTSPPAEITSEATALSASMPETLEQAQRLLQDQGMRVSRSGVALDGESKLSQGLRDIKRDRSILFKADGELQKLLSAEMDFNRNISKLRQNNVQLNARLATIGPNDITLNNQLVGALNANVGRIQLLTEQKGKLGEEIKSFRGKLNSAREAYIQRILELRVLADSIRDQYQQLAVDKNVQAAIQLINAASDKTFEVVESGRFKADERDLKKREDKVLSESIPLRNERGTLHVSAVIDGKHAQELVVDSGASLVSLPQTMALACGIQVKPSDPTIGLQLADGRLIEGKLVIISSIRVGKFTVKDVEAVVLGTDAVAAPALLGMSFLETFKFEIDAQQGRLKMIKVDTSGP